MPEDSPTRVPGDRVRAVSEPRWRWRYVLLLVPAAVLLVLAFAVMGEAAVSQPVAFNHRSHTVGLQLGCEFCHQYVLTGAHAGLPAPQVCGYCHTVPRGESAEAARLTQLLSDGTSFRFNKLFQLAGHVNYTHRRHVGVAELECVNCHGAIADTETPPVRPLIRIDMNFCIGCHEDRGQTVDCVACHR